MACVVEKISTAYMQQITLAYKSIKFRDHKISEVSIVKTIKERLLNYGVVLAGLGWILSHILFIYLNDSYSLFDVHYNYNASVYISLLVYMISLFLFDILLFILRYSEVNWLMKRCWAIYSVLMVIWQIFFMESFMTTESGASMVVTLFVWLLTPFIPMLPISYLFFFKILGMEWRMVIGLNSIIVSFLCIAHFFYFYWLLQRESQ